MLAPWLHTAALPAFAVLSVVVALIYRAVENWLSDYESYARETVARAPMLRTKAQHGDAVPFDRLDRHEVMHVEAVRHLEQKPASVLGLPLGRQRRPGGVFERRVEGQFVRRLVVEPARHAFGIAQFPSEDALPRREIARRPAD